MATKDKLYISVDLFARWRITEPLQCFLRLRAEIIRTTKDRGARPAPAGALMPMSYQRWTLRPAAGQR
jgi:hypothetical protein